MVWCQWDRKRNLKVSTVDVTRFRVKRLGKNPGLNAIGDILLNPGIYRNIFRNHECDGERKAKNGASITESIKSLFLLETRSDDLHRFPYKR